MNEEMACMTERDKKDYFALIDEYMAVNLGKLRRQLLQLDDLVEKSELEAVQGELNRVKAQVTALKNEKQRLEGQLRGQAAEVDKARLCQKELADYKTAYGGFEQMYELYMDLPEEMRQSLSGIMGNGDRRRFICGAVQEKHLEMFWDCAVQAVNDSGCSEADAERLRQLFDFCLKAVNDSEGRIVFEKVQAIAGDDYDTRFMQRSRSSRQQGTVAKLLLMGYCWKQTGKLVKKALVRIE